ncbi:hypothetical protein [Paenibacillus sp. 1001270B_150601_E10]|uniref:hypothetical protein n=1 Tax=Paenibacillus sp. 1001270B_150601_E10 TaxID=2787079 RepID=UPI0018A0246D|nr:hypothetical protein [Paenibacillus sp. 1001270B_150601_E10]
MHTNRTVELYVRGNTAMSDPLRKGFYTVLLKDVQTKNTHKNVSNIFDHTTPNRLMLLGTIYALKKLKYPCEIKLYSMAHLGLKKKKGINSDLLAEVWSLVSTGGHTLSFESNPKKVRDQLSYQSENNEEINEPATVYMGYLLATLKEPSEETMELLCSVPCERALEILLLMREHKKRINSPKNFIKRAIEEGWSVTTRA